MNIKDIDLNSSNNMPTDLAKLISAGLMNVVNGLPLDMYETIYIKLMMGEYKELLDMLACFIKSPQQEIHYLQ